MNRIDPHSPHWDTITLPPLLCPTCGREVVVVLHSSREYPTLAWRTVRHVADATPACPMGEADYADVLLGQRERAIALQLVLDRLQYR